MRLHPNAKLTPMARRLLVDRVESLGWAVARAARAAGVRLTAAYPLGPLTEGAGMNIMVVSYMDSVDFGIIACERSVPHVADIALGFGAAVADLFKIVVKAPGGLDSPTSSRPA